MVCILGFQLVGTNLARAAEVNSEGISSKYDDVPDFNAVIPSDETVEPQGIGTTVLIWVGASLVGHYLVKAADTAIEYYSGHPPEYWIKLGLAYIEKSIKDFAKKYNVMEITVSASGAVSWKCNQTPCPMPASSPIK